MNRRDDIRYQPLYTPADISRYARVPYETLRIWTGGCGKALLVPAGADQLAPFSFINLVEAHILVALRKTHRVPMQRVRKAVNWLCDTFKTSHPLAEVNLETDGRNVFVECLGRKVSASEQGQIAIPEVVSLYLQRIERDAKGPARFYPFTTWDQCPKLIVMDPRVGFGRPVIAGTRIETVMIYERYSGGEGFADIAADYDLMPQKIEEAVRCEMERRAA